MKCLNCGHTMATRRENVKYDASGLHGVTLVGVEVNRCANCGDYQVAIPHIAELHRVMANSVVRKPTRPHSRGDPLPAQVPRVVRPRLCRPHGSHHRNCLSLGERQDGDGATG